MISFYYTNKFFTSICKKMHGKQAKLVNQGENLNLKIMLLNKVCFSKFKTSF